MLRIRNIHHRGSVIALLLMCALAVSSTKADAQQEHFVPPPPAPPQEEFLPPPTPDYRHAPIPGDDYPPSAIKQHHEGSVDVLATLDANGKVIEAKVYQSSGYLELDREAMKTVQVRQFQPCASKIRMHDVCTIEMRVVFHLPQLWRGQPNVTR